MVARAGGSILYDTSNVLHHYPEDRYVGAALELFASVALMMWYVLRIFLSRRCSLSGQVQSPVRLRRAFSFSGNCQNWKLTFSTNNKPCLMPKLTDTLCL